MKLTPIEKSELERYLSYYDFTPYIRNKTFLITGSKGMCGTGIIKWLLLENEVHGTNTRVIASTRDPMHIPEYVEPHDKIEFCKFGNEAAACNGLKIDYLLHMASPTKNSFFKAHPVETLKVILEGTDGMLDIANQNSSCSMIYLSSEEIYGVLDSEQSLTESFVGTVDSLNIRSCYPLGKKAAELLCFAHSKEFGTDVKIIRPTSIQGLFQPYNEERLMNEILRCILENKNLVMKSAGSTQKCLIYTLDAASAIFTVLFKGISGQAYNASNPKTFLSAKELAVHLFEKFAPQVSIEFLNNDTTIQDGYLPRRSLLQDITKLSKLGWEPQTDLERIYEIDISRFLAANN